MELLNHLITTIRVLLVTRLLDSVTLKDNSIKIMMFQDWLTLSLLIKTMKCPLS